MNCIGKKMDRVLLILDSEKACDKVKWFFLQQVIGDAYEGV
jgi:hypothetical protein